MRMRAKTPIARGRKRLKMGSTTSAGWPGSGEGGDGGGGGGTTPGIG